MSRCYQLDNLYCSWCHGNIYLPGQHIIIKPCACEICPKCLLKAHAERGSRSLLCRCCDLQVESHQMFQARLPDGHPVAYVTEESSMSDEELKKHRPLQFLAREDLHVLQQAPASKSAQIIGLYCAVITKDPGRRLPKVHTLLKTISHVGNGPCSAEYSARLCKFSSMLDHFIFSRSLNPYKEIPTIALRKLLERSSSTD